MRLKDDWASVPASEVLGEPITIALTPERRRLLQRFGIATDFRIEAFDQGQGWLAQLEYYRFDHRIAIEGPCAFYGGSFAPNAWTGGGGLCAMGGASYSHSPLPEGMRVGRYCSIGRELKFLDFAHPAEWVSTSVAFFRPTGVARLSALARLIDRGGQGADPDFERCSYDPKRGLPYPWLGHDVWVGEQVTLAMGICIATGAVIAAGSIVTHDVPPYAVVAGVPAQVKRLRFDERIVERLLALRWWRYPYAALNRLPIDEPARFADALEEAIDNQSVPLWKPATVVLPDDWHNEEML